MADVPTANGIMVTMVYTINSQRIANVYHCSKGSPATLANLMTVAGLFESWENAFGKTHRSIQTQWVGVYTKAIDGPGSPVYDKIPLVFVPGSIAGQAFPAFTTVAVRHTTGLGGRSYRGRTYIPGLALSSQTTPDTVTVAFANLLTVNFNRMRTDLLAAGYTLMVCSKYSGVDGSGRAIPRVAGLMTPIVASEGGIGIDTQRHRKLAGVI